MLKLQRIVALTREQQKSINGGIIDNGLCHARQWRQTSDGKYISVVMTDLTPSKAVEFANGGAGGGHVCCTSAGCANSPWATGLGK
ncbi:hypothetical protein [Chryseobacterium indologenes]|uniref:Uncharacterized protein n=1 Tax=Chryseobacterium indologenes TaxID=253 RepID=A0A0N1KS72_CHRID|nr:hypothetical protein [Chryseobacterium indologenes]KPE49150.1 hypothetical protein AOB46_21630 [Chryseobacterium indologenes]